MQASSGAAFTLELWLSDVEAVFPFSTNATVTTSYKLEEVSYDMELVEDTPEIMTDINTELSQGVQIPLSRAGGNTHKLCHSGRNLKPIFQNPLLISMPFIQ